MFDVGRSLAVPGLGCLGFLLASAPLATRCARSGDERIVRETELVASGERIELYRHGMDVTGKRRPFDPPVVADASQPVADFPFDEPDAGNGRD